MKKISFLFFLFAGICMNAQTFELSGIVSNNGVPLEDAIVQITPKNKDMYNDTSLEEVVTEVDSKFAYTDSRGYYRFNLPKGVYEVKFTYGNSKTMSLKLVKSTELNIDMSNETEALEEVFINAAFKLNSKSPITHSNLDKKDIELRNLGQDIPILMNYMPSVVSTSDAGAGVGYTALRVRGSDNSRINVTINGIPYNDAESQGAFWVNLQDFASSVDNIQLQRGVGTSTNGAAAFGASLNMNTNAYSKNPYVLISNSYGSFNTHKHTAKFSTGLFNNWEFSGRASLIKSDGYIERAASTLKSYFLQSTYKTDQTLIKGLVFGGTEQTYHAWNGINETQLKNNRRYNPAGKYNDENGNVKYYDNQTDNYQQDHYQLHWTETYDTNWSSNIALHYTKGKGYYEQYEDDAKLKKYQLKPFMYEGKEVKKSDLVVQKWLDNDFYGLTFNVNHTGEFSNIILGGAINRYEGDHFGKVVYTKFAINDEIGKPYYFNQATKTDANIFTKLSFKIGENLLIYGDLQYRNVLYKASGKLKDQSDIAIDDKFNFFNPKAGISYQVNDANQLYFSYGKGQREPNRDDYENGNPKPEKLDDFELGWRFSSNAVNLTMNAYYMNYTNQLVLTGEIDHVGAFVRQNSGKSFRRGIELEADLRVHRMLAIKPNFTYSQNKNINFYSEDNGKLISYGDTDISFSPSIIASNMIVFNPIKQVSINFLSKYVSNQYMSNTEAKKSKLGDYFIQDIAVQYNWENPPLFKEITFNVLANNILDRKYVSNGYYYVYNSEENAYYYPQATANFLAGITMKF